MNRHPLLAHKNNARAVALLALLRCREKDMFVQDVLDRSLNESDLAAADRRLTANLVYSVLRCRHTLDHLLQQCCTRQPHEIEPWLWDTLRLGAAQLICMTHIPPHAALYETVQLASMMRKPRAKSFVNGVLRSLLRLWTDETGEQASGDALPHESGGYRRLSRSVLPDPKRDPVQYLGIAFALPTWLAQRWLDRYGWDECLRLGFWFCRTPPMWLRCNLLRTTREALVEGFSAGGVQCEPGSLPESIRLIESCNVRDLPGFGDGHFSVQDESAMRVAAALEPAPGQTILDLCAAPGGKTTHLAERMKNEGKIVACDIDANRLRTIGGSCQRLGIAIVETRLLHKKDHFVPPLEQYDAVLADVPCSNTGVMGRRPETRWRLKPRDLKQLVPLQTKLLLTAAERVKPGGAVVYSTCSIEPEENEGVVEAVLQAMPYLQLEQEESQMPGRPSDGGYWARLRRRP